MAFHATHERVVLTIEVHKNAHDSLYSTRIVTSSGAFSAAIKTLNTFNTVQKLLVFNVLTTIIITQCQSPLCTTVNELCCISKVSMSYGSRQFAVTARILPRCVECRRGLATRILSVPLTNA